MHFAPRGSPLRESLLLGTCLALALPAPSVLAAPASLPDWGSAAKPAPAAKPAAPEPAPTPTPAPTPPPAAAPASTPQPAATAAPAEDDVVLTDTDRPHRTRRAPRSPATSKSRTRVDKAAVMAVQTSLDRANYERTPIQEHARGLDTAGKPDEAVRSLLVGAEAYHDPVLYLVAAESTLKIAETRGRPGVADDNRAIGYVRTAQGLLETADPAAPRVDPEEHATLHAWGEDLVARAGRHKARMGVRRTGHGQLIAGGLLVSAGLAGLGVMSGGLYLSSVSKRELEKGAGRPDEDLQPLRDQQKRGETMTAAGAVLGAVGLALGIALVSLGARDLKAARTESLQTRVRVAPTFGGLVVVGRF